jgi:hypothetical protein
MVFHLVTVPASFPAERFLHQGPSSNPFRFRQSSFFVPRTAPCSVTLGLVSSPCFQGFDLWWNRIQYYFALLDVLNVAIFPLTQLNLNV